ncbi:hypothetical protein DFJ58DRAFT_153934 [Suillus subalutaceus]|uniref:uncharacterized protein n=1 Tax=Suillus subalutaceus TaxID=48586 RepID=UPI001B878DC4|nr:uncharacterized protein DFJ58DRAFT_153934 [Suillus subalutaceus]KAG1865879.1 hypothetical protein DFJ58DRAFT_153934 [Suillus subalutaceus]
MSMFCTDTLSSRNKVVLGLKSYITRASRLALCAGTKYGGRRKLPNIVGHKVLCILCTGPFALFANSTIRRDTRAALYATHSITLHSHTLRVFRTFRSQLLDVVTVKAVIIIIVIYHGLQ